LHWNKTVKEIHIETSAMGTIGNPAPIVYTQYLMNIAGWGRKTTWRKIPPQYLREMHITSITTHPTGSTF
jgi:hypothetical protein